MSASRRNPDDRLCEALLDIVRVDCARERAREELQSGENPNLLHAPRRGVDFLLEHALERSEHTNI